MNTIWRKESWTDDETKAAFWAKVGPGVKIVESSRLPMTRRAIEREGHAIANAICAPVEALSQPMLPFADPVTGVEP